MRKTAFLFVFLIVSLFLNMIAPVFASIFSDGFDDGTLDAWTGTDTTAGETLTVVSTGTPHHGTHHAKSYTDGSGTGERANCYKTISAISIVYLRFYVKFSNLPASGSGMRLGGLNTGSWAYSVALYIRNNGGQMEWGMDSEENWGSSLLWQSATINTNTYYSVEIKRDITNDQQELWVDGVSLITNTQTQTTQTTRGVVGISSTTGAATSYTVYSDCVVIDSSYIGPEGAEEEKSFSPTATITPSANVYEYKEKLFYGTETIGFATTLVMLQEMQFGLSTSVTVTTTIIKGIETISFFLTQMETVTVNTETTFYKEMIWIYAENIETVATMTKALEKAAIIFVVLETIIITAQASMIAEIIAAPVEVTTFGTLALVIAIIALAVGVVVLAGKKLL